MSKPVIEIKDLSKAYTIRHQREAAYGTLRDSIAGLAHRPLRLIGKEPMDKEVIWALNDVSFDVNQGDVVGIIGRNGSGKSTLLKILSRIVDPTKGRATLRGRTASLLEVGTGFHPELTGRENIFLNGAILGMKRQEIQKKFDEIVDFSGVEKFLDTPVKFYSSGMYVRLAFAVAAHLDPDILIVDEVLAVGDAEFQKRSLGKMNSVAREGRTVLFVSHNMNSIEQLCNVGLYLSDGRIIEMGSDVRKVIHHYLRSVGTERVAMEWKPTSPVTSSHFIPTRLVLTDSAGKKLSTPLRAGQPAWVQIEGEVVKPDPLLTIGYALMTEGGQTLYWSYPTDISEQDWKPLKKGVVTMRAPLLLEILNEGSHRIELIGGLHNKEWHFEPGTSVPAITFDISASASDSPYWLSRRPGVLAPVIKWELSQ